MFLPGPSLRRTLTLAGRRSSSFIARSRPATPTASSIASLLRDSASSPASLPRRVGVTGWIKSCRSQRHVTFLDLDDGGPAQEGAHRRVQVVLDQSAEPPECTAREGSVPLSPDDLKTHDAVRVEGLLRPSDHPKQDVEILADRVVVLGHNTHKLWDGQPYPFSGGQRKKLPAEHMRQFPHLRSKLNDFSALLRVRAELSHQIHDFFREREFVLIQTPVLTGNDCEGGGEVFRVQQQEHEVEKSDKADAHSSHAGYFGRDVFLNVSGQLHLEASCNGLKRVYNFSPVCRAEKSKSRRHLVEFTMVEAEMAFVDDTLQVAEHLEAMLKRVISGTLDKCGSDVSLYGRLTDAQGAKDAEKNVSKLLEESFVVATYDEAAEVLAKGKFKSPFVRGRPLAKEHEFYLVKKHCGGVPLFVVDWPVSTKPFYCRLREEGGSGGGVKAPAPPKAQALDLLLPHVGELAGGSLREHRARELERRIRECGLEVEPLQWYLDMRLSGSAPTGGFGLGFDRLVQFVLGVHNIRDALPFPRTAYGCAL